MKNELYEPGFQILVALDFQLRLHLDESSFYVHKAQNLGGSFGG